MSAPSPDPAVALAAWLKKQEETATRRWLRAPGGTRESLIRLAQAETIRYVLRKLHRLGVKPPKQQGERVGGSSTPERRAKCCGAFWDSRRLKQCPRCDADLAPPPLNDHE